MSQAFEQMLSVNPHDPPRRWNPRSFQMWKERTRNSRAAPVHLITNKAGNLVKRFYAKSINKFPSRYIFDVHKKAEKMKLGLMFSD